MILRHPRTSSQVTPASVPAYLSWARRPCVDGTGFDTCRHLGCRRAFGRSGSEIASPSTHGTVAVDLESHVAARIATARNLSFAA
jgi:hypothetical protein